MGGVDDRIVIERKGAAAARASCRTEPFDVERLLTGTPRPRAVRLDVIASVVAHLALLVVVLILPARAVVIADPEPPVSVVFLLPEPVVEPATPEPVLPDAPDLQPPPPAPLPESMQDSMPEPIPEPPPAPEPAEPEPEPPPAPEPEAPTPNIRTQVFGDTATDTPIPVPPRRRERTGLFGDGRANGPAGEGGARVASGARVGAFEVATAGGESEGGSRRTAAVRRGSFGDANPRPADPERVRQRVERPDTPVEILSKPKPAYSDEARRLRVEGEVELEVVFEASGRLRVLGIRRGLGHGLDEAAVEAALQVVFKPALRDGHPVDHAATLRVLFQLA